MNCLRNLVLAALVLLATPQNARTAEGSSRAESFEPLVVVLTRFAGRMEIGNGFVVGDGSFIVTARHLVFDESLAGRHSMQGLVSVITPYLGRAADTRIVANDVKLDLALLENPWRRHPAYAIADDESLLSSEHLLVAGLPDVGPNIFAPDLPPERIDIQTQILPVDFVAVRRKTPQFIAMIGTGRIRKGWSGSVVLLPGTSLAVGCHTRVVGRGPSRDTGFTGAEGPALAQVGPLLATVGLEISPPRPDAFSDRPTDADDAFLRCIAAIHYASTDHWAAVLQHAEVLVRLRLQTAFGYRMAAKAAAELRQYSKAQKLFRKALDFDPEGILTRFFYVEFLVRRGKTDQAIDILDEMWQSGVTRPAVAMEFFNVLFHRKDYDRLSDLLQRALKDEPRNAYLWLWLGACRQRMNDNDAALDAFSRAVELCPDRGVFHSSLAAFLSTIDRLDDAERHYRRFVEIEPDSALAHFLLAGFLSSHRPHSQEEALREAKTALNLPPRKDLPTATIQKLVDGLQPGSASQESAPSVETPIAPQSPSPETPPL